MGGIRGYYISNGGRARAPTGRQGGRGLSAKEAGWRAGTVGGQTRMGKYFPVVGDLRPYRGTYQGGTGGQTGNRETDQVPPVQHPERPKRGSGIVT